MLGMGIFHVDIDVVASGGADAERHLVLVDTGASYLSLPGSVLRRLGYRPLDRQRVIFATGQVAVWSVTEVKVRLFDRERTVIAFFADETAPKLVGAQTLESFGLGVDPLGRRLVPVDAYLAAVGASGRLIDFSSVNALCTLTRWGAAAAAPVDNGAADPPRRPGVKIERVPDEPSRWPALTRGVLSADRLRRDLGWMPTYDLDSGVAAYIGGLRQQPQR
jgi:predicted aspartyl protease